MRLAGLITLIRVRRRVIIIFGKDGASVLVPVRRQHHSGRPVRLVL
jgi:hypothetical protein